MPEPLFDWQIDDLAFYMKNERCVNLSDPGSAKTPTVCVYLEWLWNKKKCKSIWTMPKSLMRKNRDELLRFTNFTKADIAIVDGTPAVREEIMNRPAKVFIMGFKRFSDDWKKIRTLHPEIDMVAIDEVHMGFKSHNSQRTKELFVAMRSIKHFLPMSGSLIDGRLDSAYPTIHIIEPRYYTNHWSFMAQHAISDEYGRVIMWSNHEKLGRIFKRHGIRRTFESVWKDAQKPVIITERVEMSEKQRKIYNEFEEKAILELEDGYLEGFNPAVNAIRCRQIMAHPETFKLLKEGEITGKDEALQVHLEDHINKKEPILIYAALVPEQERIAKICTDAGFKVGLMNGATSAPDRSDIDEKFRSGEIDCIVGSPQVAAVGFNWGHIDHVVFTSLNYQNVDFVQAYRRAIRGARKKPLRVTVLEYADSIDQRIFQIVNKKSLDLAKVDSSYDVLTLGSQKEDSILDKVIDARKAK